MRESGPRSESTEEARTLTESQARLKRLRNVFLMLVAGAAVEYNGTDMQIGQTEPEPPVAAKTDTEPTREAHTEKAASNALIAEWGFNPKDINITKEDLLHLPTISNRDTLQWYDTQISKESVPASGIRNQPSADPSRFDDLKRAAVSEIAKNWSEYYSLSPDQQSVAMESLIISYAVDSNAERKKLADAVAKTEVQFEDDRIVAIYHADPHESIVLHEWLPDQSPLAGNIVLTEKSLYQMQLAEEGHDTYLPSKDQTLQSLIKVESPENPKWVKQVIVNEIQKELLFADFPETKDIR